MSNVLINPLKEMKFPICCYRIKKNKNKDDMLLIMTMPDVLSRIYETKPPYIRSEKKLPKEQTEHLMKNQNMKGLYLGACLDSCRWGSATTVMYEMSERGLVEFIQNWMQQNKENFTQLFHENRSSEICSLPHINDTKCKFVLNITYIA